MAAHSRWLQAVSLAAGHRFGICSEIQESPQKLIREEQREAIVIPYNVSAVSRAGILEGISDNRNSIQCLSSFKGGYFGRNL